jgi:hypothetical protein
MDRQLSREVHEFFTSATKQAATIVQKVAQTAKEETGTRLTGEMEDFLFDALQRMNAFVMQMMQRKNTNVAEQELETHMRNLLGPVLDGFRNAGTAAVPDKHLGQDPFATATSAVRDELGARVLGETDATEEGPSVIPEQPSATLPPVSPERHPVTELLADSAEMKLPPPPAPVTRTTSNTPPAATAGKPAAATPESKPATPRAEKAAPRSEEQERFKTALKNLVRQGLMSKEEAKAAWQAKKEAPNPS